MSVVMTVELVKVVGARIIGRYARSLLQTLLVILEISLRLLALLKHAILCAHNHNGVLCLPIGKMTVYLGQPRSWATQIIGTTFTRLIIRSPRCVTLPIHVLEAFYLLGGTLSIGTGTKVDYEAGLYGCTLMRL